MCEIMEEPVAMRLAAPEIQLPGQPIMNLGATVYPNPAKDKFTVRLPNEKTNAFIELFDLSGRKVFGQKLQNNITEIPTTSFSGCRKSSAGSLVTISKSSL